MIAKLGFIQYLAWWASGIVVSHSIWCWTMWSGIPFRSLCIQTKASLYSLSVYYAFCVISKSKSTLSFTNYGFSLVPKLNDLTWTSFDNVHLAILKSCTLIRIRITSIKILLNMCEKSKTKSLILNSKLVTWAYKISNFGMVIVLIANKFGTTSKNTSSSLLVIPLTKS